MFVKNVAAVLIVVVLSTKSVEGQSLFNSVPSDGVWAKYKVIVSEVNDDGNLEMKNASELTIRVVGTRHIGMKAFRWIELESISTTPRHSWHRIGKMLVLEDAITEKRGWDTGFRYGWIWNEGIENDFPKRVEKSMSDFEVFQIFMPKELKFVKQLSKKEIKTESGTYSCEGWSGHTSTVIERSVNTYINREKYDAYFNQRSPFGLVQFERRWTIQSNGRNDLTTLYSIKLVEFGTKATSALPDYD